MISKVLFTITTVSAILLCGGSPAEAFVLHTSARVEIVPGVEILRVGTNLPFPGDEPASAKASGPEGFYIDGPADQAVRVAWTTLSKDRAATPPSTSASRHDESGGLILEYDRAAGGGDDGYLLILEYE